MKASKRVRGTKPPPLPEPKPPLDREEAKRLYLEEHLTVDEIARRMGYAYKTVRGALRSEGLRLRQPTSRRGKWAELLYPRWVAMRGRCLSPRHGQYSHYGARGVGICPEWEHFPAFHAWALSNGFRPDLYLTLIDRERDFSPGNCRWVTASESRERALADGRIPRRGLTAFGETKSMTEWLADPRCKATRSSLKQRLVRGHSPEAALTFPPGAIFGVAKPELRPWEVRSHRVPDIDWEALEREWLRRPTSYAALARRLKVSTALVRSRLKHLPHPARSPVLPRGQERNLDTVWRNLVAKCTDPSDRLYPFVGAKGITLARAWRERDKFLAWAADSCYRPGLWLARSNPRLGYTPANCRWLEPTEAMRQRRYDVKHPRPRWALQAFGETRSLFAWTQDPRCAVSSATVAKRLRAGWSVEDALTTPPKARGRKPRIFISAFGETKTIRAWCRDSRCKVGPAGLRDRLERGIPAKVAITTPGFQLAPELVRLEKRGDRARRVARARAPRPAR